MSELFEITKRRSRSNDRSEQIMRTYSQSDVLNLLREKQGKRTLRDFAEIVGVSATLLSDIFAAHRNPGPKVLQYLGLKQERTVTTVYFEEKSQMRGKQCTILTKLLK